MLPPAPVRAESCNFVFVLTATRLPPRGRPMADAVDPHAPRAEHAHDHHQGADADRFLDQRLPQDGKAIVGHTSPTQLRFEMIPAPRDAPRGPPPPSGRPAPYNGARDDGSGYWCSHCVKWNGGGDEFRQSS